MNIDVSKLNSHSFIFIKIDNAVNKCHCIKSISLIMIHKCLLICVLCCDWKQTPIAILWAEFPNFQCPIVPSSIPNFFFFCYFLFNFAKTLQTLKFVCSFIVQLTIVSSTDRFNELEKFHPHTLLLFLPLFPSLSSVEHRLGAFIVVCIVWFLYEFHTLNLFNTSRAEKPQYTATELCKQWIVIHKLASCLQSSVCSDLNYRK